MIKLNKISYIKIYFINNLQKWKIIYSTTKEKELLSIQKVKRKIYIPSTIQKKEKKIIEINSSKSESLNNQRIENPGTNEEENMSELVFQLNTKSSGVECFLCQKDLSKNIKFLYAECGNKIFCINSLITKRHSPEHQFQVIYILNYSFLQMTGV